MDFLTYSAARGKLAETMERVCRDHAPVVISRKAKSKVVMISLEDYESMEETDYLLRSPANARRLRAAKESVERGEVVRKTIKELKDA